VPLAGWVPAGLDGGLVAVVVVVLDLALTWIGTPVGWLRQLVRVLSTGTVAANAVAGWPDPVATGLHIAAPLILLAMIEAGRTVLLRRIGEVHGTRREPIPLIRWLLAPWRTLLLWRRMALWQITSYRTAIATELQLRRAMTLLRIRYGHRWRRRAPADLVWMLRTGVYVGEACERVGALADIDDCAEPAETISLGSHRAAVQSELVPRTRHQLPRQRATRLSYLFVGAGVAQATPVASAACLGKHDVWSHTQGLARATIDWGVCSGGTAFVNIDLADTACDNRSAEAQYTLNDTAGVVINNGWFRNGQGYGTTAYWDKNYGFSGNLVSLRIRLRACSVTCSSESNQTISW
jgi:hypothetical protein